MPISYLDGPRLRRAVLAACSYGQRAKGELNRINVFPVPDGDTGTNLALTLRSIAGRLAGVGDRRIDRVAAEIAEAAVLGARGNCGMMLSHFLLGLSRDLDGHGRIGTREFGGAFWAGAAALENALDEPVEGTILTVIRESADEARTTLTPDFGALMQTVRDRAQSALARTPDLLPVLREAGVVDAGAKGFVSLLEGVVRLIEGTSDDEASEEVDPKYDEGPSPVALAEFPHQGGGRYRFCTEGLVEGDALPTEDEVRAVLREGAEELIVIRTRKVLKVHLHTDEPERAFDYLRSVGTLVAHKAEDMRAQHDTARRAGAAGIRRPVGVVTDSASDLPERVARAHGIEIVPLQLIEGDRSLRDRFDVSAEEFHRRLGTDSPLPTTSQPTPGSFVETFKAASTEAEALVVVLLARALSGTLASAEAASRLVPEAGVRIVDSRGASLLTGLLALKAAELAEGGLDPDGIVHELDRIRGRSNILFTVRTLDRLMASGRVSRFAGWLGGFLDLKPVLGLEPDGTVKAYGKARGESKVRALVLDMVAREIGPDPGRVRFGLVHVGAPEVLTPVEAELKERFGSDVEILTSPATPVIATHLGIGAWGVAYMVEDG
ncbi:MAG: DegV family EDD domain-containing protein [Gemmatimonadota bacterium]|nr:DegV family EDD domain-containing protein [Gemmatimonadota bacterium]